MYQNVNFLRRFTIDLINFIIYAIVIYLIFWGFSHNSVIKEKINALNYYLAFVIAIFWSNLYYFFFPWLTKGKMFGEYIFKCKVIDTDSKVFKIKMLLKRNIIAAFFISFIFLFFLATIYPSDIKVTDKKIPQLNESIKNDIAIKVSTTLFSILGFTKFANYFLLVFWKKRLSLTDFLTNSRVVFNKQIEATSNNQYILEPFRYQWRQIYRSDQFNLP
ncbi:RDD family protein [Mycoplasma sp. 5912]